MKIPKVVDSRLGYLSAALFMLVSVVAPAALTASASAAVVTSRSLQPNSSAINATPVTYELKFTAPSTAGALVLAFCSESPIPNETCTAPTDLDVTNVASADGTASDMNANTIKFVGSIAASTNTITFTGIDNPSVLGMYYARLLTYADGTAADAYDETDGIGLGTYIDEGGFALSATDPISVSAAVRETLAFCVSAADPDANCTNTTTPNLELGEGSTPKALDSNATSTGTIYNQLSTNAVGGATVKMKTNNTCGGLKRAGAAVCDIAPVATSTDAIAAGTAKFGMKVTAAGFTVSTNYNGSNYGFNYAANNSTGVTSAYGDTVYSSAGPVDDEEATMNFAASISSTTPAGKYQASLNLIATGTF